ncbi:MAG TPA: hypothetical protein H9894_05375 [Candidatus Desulfovibrio intestinipullorum]|uniref:Uncharacterized protein n=1 Tax=Candidatus Desulfovibrio intestinipullorum TaxID=2838536 RepID=A0A9D1TPE5_9BACT|nr:hypothetical protein [Candidatus Desulfovibrio intestinipullorum]
MNEQNREQIATQETVGGTTPHKDSPVPDRAHREAAVNREVPSPAAGGAHAEGQGDSQGAVQGAAQAVRNAGSAAVPEQVAGQGSGQATEQVSAPASAPVPVASDSGPVQAAGLVQAQAQDRKSGSRNRRAARRAGEEQARELADWLAEQTAARTADRVMARLEERDRARAADEQEAGAGKSGNGNGAQGAAGTATGPRERLGCVVQAVFFFVIVSCTNALAATSLGDMADNLKGELSRFGPLLQAGFALGGFFLVGLGLWQLWSRSQQPGQPKGSAIIAIVIGCGLLGAATVAQMGAGSLGTGTPELSEIGL